MDEAQHNLLTPLSEPDNLAKGGTTKRIIFIFLFILMIGYIVITNTPIYHKTIELRTSSSSKQNLLDGCQYVYIDLGTNIGVQIRKLYEPHLYPNAPVLPLFKQIFGNHSNEVCSIGFEANPLHDSYLKAFENYCLQRNWRVKIFTSTAVTIAEKNVTFYTEPGNEANNQWGASLVTSGSNNKQSVTVPGIDIISWFRTTILPRKIDSKVPLLKIMMKTDIEGHDSVVIANFIFSGLYCFIDLIYGEHLDESFGNALSLLEKHSGLCKTKLIYMDDESYHTARFPFIVNKSIDRSSTLA